jgi:hypothetical protein
MIKYVSEYDELPEYVIHHKGNKIKCYTVDDPIIKRWEKFQDFYLKKRTFGNKIRSVQILYKPITYQTSNTPSE